MEPTVRNFLYRHPEYYESVVQEPNDETPMMCRRMFSRFLPSPPASILDIGCGTGRDLASLSRECGDCWGVDFLPEMIDYAKARHPGLKLQVGDMRSVRLGRTFDIIMIMGSAFMYALDNADVRRTLRTFVEHSHHGSLLIVDINNGASYLGGGTFKPRTEFRIDSHDFKGEAVSEFGFDRRRQIMARKRAWIIDGRDPEEDFCEYRLFFPAELEHLLSVHGFRVAGMFDNMDLRETDLSGPRLYTAAIFGREESDA